MATTDNHERHELAARLRQSLSQLPVGKREEIANSLNVKPNTFSMYCSGQRPLPSDLLPKLARLTGVKPDYLLGLSEHDAVPSSLLPEPFAHTLPFLGHCASLGLYDVFADRLAALDILAEAGNRMHRGRICITGSTFKGLQQDMGHEFIRLLANRPEKRPLVDVEVLLTHPTFAFLREKLEARSKGAIVTEVFQGIRWCIEGLAVPPQNIRLTKASPTCFSIFLSEGHNGVGVVNPYPLMRQSFVSFSLVVRTLPANFVQSPSPASLRSHALYNMFFPSNFQSPWDDGTGRITVSLIKALEECAYSITDIQEKLGLGLTDDDARFLKEGRDRLLKDCPKINEAFPRPNTPDGISDGQDTNKSKNARKPKE